MDGTKDGESEGISEDLELSSTVRLRTCGGTVGNSLEIAVAFEPLSLMGKTTVGVVVLPQEVGTNEGASEGISEGLESSSTLGSAWSAGAVVVVMKETTGVGTGNSRRWATGWEDSPFAIIIGVALDFLINLRADFLAVLVEEACLFAERVLPFLVERP